MQYLEGHPIISEQITTNELVVILRELEDVLTQNIEGDVVELGCFEGTAALFLQRKITAICPDKQLWLYDSFEGLPNKTIFDLSPLGEAFSKGKLKTNKSVVIRNFKKAGLPVPRVKKAWFSDLKTTDLPENICFAFLDGDFYESIRDSLELTWSKISQNGIVIIDDYGNDKLPGTKKATDGFFSNKNCLIKTEKSLAIIKK